MERQRLFSISIHDCRVDTFRSGGPGGQHQNKTDSGVRITHVPSGAVGESREGRSQRQNKAHAFRRMAESPAFRHWVRLTAARLLGHPSVDSRVEAAMHPRHVRCEVRDTEGRWVHDVSCK